MSRMGLLSVLLLAVCAACGGSDGPTGPGGPGGPNNGSFTARIDGTNWAATIITPSMAQTTGHVSAVGSGSPTFSLAFAWQDQLTTGTWTIGTGGQSIGFNANMIQGGQVWVAGAGMGSGTLTITTRTASRVAGTFSFTLMPSQGGATGNRQVTNGQFDVTF